MATLGMVQDILQGVGQRVTHLRSLTDPDRNDPPSPTFALNVKEGLRSCSLLRDYLKEALKLLIKEVIADKVDDYNMVGRMYQSGFDLALSACAAIRKRAWDVKAQGVPEEIRSQFEDAFKAFEQAATDIEGLKSEFAERWPWIDQEKLARSIADERLGVRRRSAKEVFDELRRRFR